LKISPEGPFVARRLAATRLAIAGALVAFAIGISPVAQAREVADSAWKTPAATVQVAELPAQARETYVRIRQGGPFPYDKDGAVFDNRERQLPRATRGWYREYTVTTPGSRDRGARRIVCGGPVRSPHACWYSADHYASFRMIVE
jgi:ribonuclease T1